MLKPAMRRQGGWPKLDVNMVRIREEFDADKEPTRYSDAATGPRRFEIICSECGSSVFTDLIEHDRIVSAVEVNPDNQFVCDKCVEADNEAAYQTS